MSAFGAFFAELPPRIKRNRGRLSAATLYAFLTCALGTSTAIAVAASPVCSQVIHKYVDRLERNRVSGPTLRKWRAWGIGHPNWHPNVATHRAKYKKVREEIATNEPISCPIFDSHPGEVPLLDAHLDIFFLPVDAPDVTSILNPVYPPIYTNGPSGPFGPVPVGLGPVAPPVMAGVVPPVVTPPNTPTPPVAPEPVPEPNSILLALTGIFGIAALVLYQRRTALPE